MAIPVHFDAPCEQVESILLTASRVHAVDPTSLDRAELDHLKSRFGMAIQDFGPRVYWRITHDWMELTVRFLTPSHGSRDIKDRLSRVVHAEFQSKGIQVAATRYEILGALREEADMRPSRSRPVRPHVSRPRMRVPLR